MKKTIFILNLILGHVITLLIVSAIAVYGFDYYEGAYGKDISFQTSLFYVAIGAFITGLGFSIGVALSTNTSKYYVALLAGGFFALIIIASTIISGKITDDISTRQNILCLFWLLGSIIIPIAISKSPLKILCNNQGGIRLD